MTRLDQELVARGLARSRSHAAQLIAAGRVHRGQGGDTPEESDAPLRKASTSIAADDPLMVREGDSPDYVSRAGHKLDGALAAFPDVMVKGRRCLDAGASTGGFTDVLLRSGAREVVAVDVGHGQLVEELRNDPRVHVHEGLNVRIMEPADIGGTVDLTVADLSFISLTLVLESLAAATRNGGDLVLMIKPQFELGRSALNRNGVVTLESKRRAAVVRVVRAALMLGLEVRAIVRSPLRGQDGNVEFFVWIKVPDTAIVPRIEEETDQLAELAIEAGPAFRVDVGSAPTDPSDTTELND
ncbi:TlyA family RNA methyltransferase [Arthrobacter sp. H5]|uniref:TlyA family RNA methyltransferase n=1 Tax=Arthrobacter sp. H5 TaxID=1267973 RepID=UPI0004828503|nr:TlyA family RNA methyltransferase [Arthrobacter sp. H5]